MIQYHIYPGGKRRIVTFSYDDGSALDERLVALFNQYGVKGSFHLNGRNYLNADEKAIASIRARYAGHEISCHTIHHGWPARMPMPSILSEVWEDRKILEKVAGYPVVGMSYPSGSYNDATLEVLQACGIVYSRTTKSTKDFSLPENFLTWHPTCHHRDALALCDTFLENLDSEWRQPLFYVWGHSHEFRTEDDWTYIEEVVKKLAGNEKIWYATNIEIVDYFNAQKCLRISADEKIFVNPTSMDLWVERNKSEIIKVPAGQTVVAD